MEFYTEIVNTIWYICIYSLMAIPLTLSYRISKIINFAHGIYITLGAYTAILVGILLGGKVSPFIGVPLAFLMGSVTALLTDRIVFAPLVRRNSNQVTLMIASMGAWTFIKYAFYALLDTLGKIYKVSFFYTTPNIDFPEKINLLGFEINGEFMFIVSTTVIILLLLALFLTRTRLGLALQAIADNLSLSQLSGISKDATMAITWFIAGGIAGVGGFVLSLFSYVSPELGDVVILQIFACSVIGGLMSLPMTLVGAVIISSAENLLIVILYNNFGVELSFRPFLSFMALMLVILLKPPSGASGGLPYRFKLRGFFGRKQND